MPKKLNKKTTKQSNNAHSDSNNESNNAQTNCPELAKTGQDKSGAGNTDSQPPPSQTYDFSRSNFWVFTYNNYDIGHIGHFTQLLDIECEWYVFQEEIGDKGTPHLQGSIKLKTRKRMSELKKLFGPTIHWEITKSVPAAIEYAKKVKTRNGQIFTKGIKIPEPLDIDEPWGWQLELMDIIQQKPDKRTIWWLWEPKGNVGKTSFCKFLCAKHNALMLSGKSSDMFHMLTKFEDKRKLIIVDIPRSTQDFINYGALESIKNGLIFSGKYEGAQLLFNCPHLLCFSNQKPDVSKMSGDRWKIRYINVEEQKLEESIEYNLDDIKI